MRPSGIAAGGGRSAARRPAHAAHLRQRPRSARPYGVRAMLVSAVKSYASVDTGAMAPGGTTFLVRLALP
jgi:hypothetical protein